MWYRRKIENCSKIQPVVLRYELRSIVKIYDPGSHKLRHCLIQDGDWLTRSEQHFPEENFTLLELSYTSKCKTNC